eukprot:6449874-Pyramimonas_sp.AAC.1
MAKRHPIGMVTAPKKARSAPQRERPRAGGLESEIECKICGPLARQREEVERALHVIVAPL